MNRILKALAVLAVVPAFVLMGLPGYLPSRERRRSRARMNQFDRGALNQHAVDELPYGMNPSQLANLLAASSSLSGTDRAFNLATTGWATPTYQYRNERGDWVTAPAYGAGSPHDPRAGNLSHGGGVDTEAISKWFKKAFGKGGSQTAGSTSAEATTASSTAAPAATGGTKAAAMAKYGKWANTAIQAYNAYAAAKEGRAGTKGSTEQYRTPYGNEYIAPLIRFILDQQAKIYNSRQGIYGGPTIDLGPMAQLLAGVSQNYSGVGRP